MLKRLSYHTKLKFSNIINMITVINFTKCTSAAVFITNAPIRWRENNTIQSLFSELMESPKTFDKKMTELKRGLKKTKKLTVLIKKTCN